MSLTLQQAIRTIEAAFAKAASLKTAPMTIAVVDAGGHLVALHRQDGSSNLRSQIAKAKAEGALALGFSSRKISEIAKDNPAAIAAMTTLSGGAVVPSPGAVIAIDTSGAVVGAVGATGDTPDNDELCAIAGVQGAGLTVRD